MYPKMCKLCHQCEQCTINETYPRVKLQNRSQIKHPWGKQTYAINYFENYAPVVTWFAIRLLIIFAILFKWALKQVDFFMAYTQAPIEMYMCMELPAGIEAKHGDCKSHF